MKKVLFAALILLSLIRAAFSEIKFSPDFSISPSIDSRFGYLFYTPSSSSYFHTERLEVDTKTKVGEFKIGGCYIYGNSDRAMLNGKLEYGSADFEFKRNFYAVRYSFSSFSFPGELKIFDEIPRFSLNDGCGKFMSFGGDINFSLFDTDLKFSTDFIFGKANVQKGDLYYFYGKPDNLVLFGGKTQLKLPYGFEFFTLGGKLTFDIDTNEGINVGESKLQLLSAFLAKEFYLPVRDEFMIKPFLGYAYLSLNGNAYLTSSTQKYLLFPYKFAGGNIDEKFNFVSLGNSLEFKRGGLCFTLDLIYFYCMKNYASGDYAYKYKKSIFFDGSSDNGPLNLPDATGMHVFAGITEISYKFNIHKNFIPTLRLTKMVAATILNQSTKDFLNAAFSSYSTVGSASESLASAEDNDTLKKALLSGTSISLRIDF